MYRAYKSAASCSSQVVYKEECWYRRCIVPAEHMDELTLITLYLSPGVGLASAHMCLWIDTVLALSSIAARFSIIMHEADSLAVKRCFGSCWPMHSHGVCVSYLVIKFQLVSNHKCHCALAYLSCLRWHHVILLRVGCLPSTVLEKCLV